MLIIAIGQTRVKIGSRAVKIEPTDDTVIRIFF